MINNSLSEVKIPSILIVDDEINFAHSIVKILKLKKFDVSQANNGLEAVELIKKERYDIIFLDIRMPRMNGVEAFKRIKAVSPKTLVVLMTAYTKDELIKEALNQGVLKVLFKPFDIKEMISIINNYTLFKNNCFLIVDDNQSFANSFRKNLEKLNYKCQIAYNGKQAIELINKNNFNIVFMDIKLPDLNGVDLLLKLMDIKKDIFVVMITAYRDENGMPNQIQQALDNNAFSCLFKPFEFSQVVNIISEFHRIKLIN